MADTTIDLLKNSSYIGKMDELIAAVKSGSGATSDVEWNNVKNKPTTIGGYGITDAKIDNGTITLGNQTITPLTSAPVTSVNSKTGAVTLSAADVSAIPSTLTGTAGQVLTKTADGQEWKDVDIPTALPNPNALTFTGAVIGSYDGSAPLTVEIPSGGGNADRRWKLIKTLNVSTDVAQEYFDTDDDGNSFSVQEIFITGTMPDIGSGYLYCRPLLQANAGNTQIWPTKSKNFKWYLGIYNNLLRTAISISNNAIIGTRDQNISCPERITGLTIGASAGYNEAGTIYVYGR